MIKTVKAKKVREGDFIPGLDNAYVFEVDSDPRVYGQYGYQMADGWIEFSFHTAEGEEGVLRVPFDMPITIERPDDVLSH